MLAEFGVNSEVGKLGKVMVHRPELSLQLLTPTNHDELLFDDVLWVERETGADPRILALALAVIGITLVTFLVTTLADEPASIVTLLAILLVSVGLDIGWSRRRDSTTTQIGGS